MSKNKSGAVKRKKAKRLARQEKLSGKGGRRRQPAMPMPRNLEDLDRMEREQRSQAQIIIPIIPGMDYIVPSLRGI